MKILDSSFLVGFYLDDDALHAKAVEMAKAHEDEQWMLPDTILFETLSVLRLNLGAAGARAVHEKLMSNRQVVKTYFEAEDRKSILELFLDSPLSISAADASVAYLCRKLGVGALNFDNNLAKVIEKQKGGV